MWCCCCSGGRAARFEVEGLAVDVEWTLAHGSQGVVAREWKRKGTRKNEEKRSKMRSNGRPHWSKVASEARRVVRCRVWMDPKGQHKSYVEVESLQSCNWWKEANRQVLLLSSCNPTFATVIAHHTHYLMSTKPMSFSNPCTIPGAGPR